MVNGKCVIKNYKKTMQNTKIITPENVKDLMKIIDELQAENFRFGAGFTDLLLELEKSPEEKVTIINLAKINTPEFSEIKFTEDKLIIGSLVTASSITKNPKIKKLFPVLFMAANQLASKQIRQVATVGGNLCTASPAGDISTALVALGADCEIINSRKELRSIPINAFFKGVRKTALKSDEILQAVSIPLQKEKVKSEFIKIGTRNAMECTIVSLAYHFILGEDNSIQKAGIAIGSSAPTIKFTHSASEFLKGKKLNEIDEEQATEFAEKVMEYSNPISDVRSSAWYRKQVLFNISKGIFDPQQSL